MPHTLPAGKLLPLPIPQCPWSHITIDFITDLPDSRGNTIILVIVDQFSKSLWRLPLPSLPTAFATAELVFNHVFCYYGIPEDILSDQGPQFISHLHGKTGCLCRPYRIPLAVKWPNEVGQPGNLVILKIFLLRKPSRLSTVPSLG